MVTFDFYISTYYGQIFKTNPNGFFNAANKAELLIKNRGVNPSNFEESVYQSCICAVAEFLKQNEEKELKEMNGISSESVGGYSISYTTASHESKAIFNSKIDDILALYLGRSFRLKRMGGAEIVL